MISKRLSEVRKAKKHSQDEVGKMVNAHSAVIGRYKRDEVKPTIKMANNLAEALEVSLDYLAGATDTLLKTNVINRILDIQKLKDNDKQHVLLSLMLSSNKLKCRR